MEEMVDAEYDASTCEGIDEDTLNCNTKKTEHQDFDGMTGNHKQDARGEGKDTQE